MNNKFFLKYIFRPCPLTTFLFLSISVILHGQSAQNRNWEYSKDHYSPSPKNSIIITNSLPRGGGLVQHNGKEYNYFIFWASIQNATRSTLALQFNFPKQKFFNGSKSHVKVAFTKAKMTSDKVQEFDYGLKDLAALLNKESNQVKRLETKVLPNNAYMFYIPVFIHKTKWPVRAAFILKEKELFYKIIAGTDTIMVPCGELKKEKTAALKIWEASPDGVRFKNWEASNAGKKVHNAIIKISKSIKTNATMEGVLTAVVLPAGSRLGYGFMAKIKDEEYIFSFGIESKKEFDQLRRLQINDKIIIRSHSVTKAPKYAYPIVAVDFVEKNGKILYKRPARKGGC